MTTKTKIEVIEHEKVERDYDMMGNIAIVDHPKHGRLLIEDSFGGMDSLAGGAVRWKHGGVYHLQPGGTLQSLRDGDWDGCGTVSTLAAVLHCEDNERPLSDLSPEKIAEQAGL